MDVLLSHANWKLNMKRREAHKPDLNPPYTRLCKEVVKLSSKLFGEELSKQLEEMTEAKKVGQQMQQPTSSKGAGRRPTTFSDKGFNPHFQGHSKPYDRPISSQAKRPFSQNS